MPAGGRKHIQFSIFGLLWGMAGVGFVIEHALHIGGIGQAPSLVRMIWIVSFVVIWAVVGHVFVLSRH